MHSDGRRSSLILNSSQETRVAEGVTLPISEQQVESMQDAREAGLEFVTLEEAGYHEAPARPGLHLRGADLFQYRDEEGLPTAFSRRT